MSQTTTTAEASERFKAIFQAAIKSYQKQTKEDLLAHPLASQLQSCSSTGAVIAILQIQVQEFDKSRTGSGDDRLTKWLNPTVNVLSAFSAAISGGVGLVSLDSSANVSLGASSHVYFVGIFACECNFRRHWCLPFGEYPIYFFGRIVHTVYLLGGPERCSQQRNSRRTLRTHRMFFCTTRNLYKGGTNYGNDKHNHGDNGRSA